MKVARIECVGKDGMARTIYDESQAKPGAVVRCLADVQSEPVHWLWPGRIPLGKLTLLIGDPGLGKSLLTVDIAARLSRGEAFADSVTCDGGGTIFLSAEDDAADTIRPRLDAAGADVSRIHVLEAVRVSRSDGSTTEKQFSLETDIAHLEAKLSELPDVRLVVVDPLSAYLGGKDSHANAEIRGLLSPLAAMASRRRVAVLCVTHLRKSPGAAVHRAIGSIAFAAAARAVWAVACDPGDVDRRVFVPVKQNLSAPASGLAFRVVAPDGVARIEWESGAVSLTANDVLGDNGPHEEGVLAETREWLANELAGGPVAKKQIMADAKQEGFSPATLRRAKTDLGVIAEKAGFQGPWYWRLEDAQTKGAQAHISSMSTFGTTSEKTIDNGKHNSKGAQDSRLNIFDNGDGEVRV